MLGPTKGWEAAYTWSDKIGDDARANRMLMVEAMMNAGFSNCRDEYWHYSWGDSAWAVRTGANQCPYGWVHPPVMLDTHTPDGMAQIESVHTVRDQGGRVARAEASVCPVADASSAASSSCRVRFRVNWANGVALTVRLHGATERSIVDLHTFQTGDGGEVWQKVEEIYCEGDAIVLHITPQSDRIVVSNFVSAPLPVDEVQA